MAPRVYLLGFHTVINPNKIEDRAFLNSAFKDMNYFSSDMEVLLEYLVKHNFWFLSAQELYDYFITHSQKIPAKHVGQKPLMLSFDDGYKNIHTNLLPILEKLEAKYGRKVKVVVFANPGTLADYESNSSFHMTCRDLREGLEKSFYDVQSHGLNHKNLTKINLHDLVDEVGKAQLELKDCTTDLDPNNLVAAHIAYPYGATNKQVQKYVSKYYLSGYLYDSQVLKIGWLRNQYQIPRLTVNWQKTPQQLIQMVERSSKLKKTES